MYSNVQNKIFSIFLELLCDFSYPPSIDKVRAVYTGPVKWYHTWVLINNLILSRFILKFYSLNEALNMPKYYKKISVYTGTRLISTTISSFLLKPRITQGKVAC